MRLLERILAWHYKRQIKREMDRAEIDYTGLDVEVKMRGFSDIETTITYESWDGVDKPPEGWVPVPKN